MPLLALADGSVLAGVINLFRQAWHENALVIVAVGLGLCEAGYWAYRIWQLRKKLSRFPNAVRRVKDAVRKFAEKTEEDERRSSANDLESIYVDGFLTRILWRNIPDSKLLQIEQAIKEHKNSVLRLVPGGNEIQMEWTRQVFELRSSVYFPGGGEDQYVSSESKGWYGSIEVTTGAQSRSESRGTPKGDDWEAAARARISEIQRGKQEERARASAEM
jgi:hypothetical protein